MITSDDRIEYEAKKLVFAYFENIIPGTDVLAEGGMEEMKDRFGRVPSDQRADVFVRFRELLRDRGIEFDNEVAA